MVSQTIFESVASCSLIFGFLGGLITGWSLRERKATEDEKYRTASIEQQMIRDGWVK